MIKFLIGKTYKINHSRKGRFALQVDNVDDEWVSGVIVGNKPAAAMMEYNVKYPGEQITVRIEHCRCAEEVQ